MLKNYLKISLRHIWQNKLYSGINISGLAAGITCMLLAVLFMKDEWSYDTFHKNNPYLYRITTTLAEKKGETPVTTGGTGQVQGPAFKMQVPEIVNYTRVMGGDIYDDLAVGDKVLRLQTLFADPSFFDVFSFSFLHGNAQTALDQVNSIVITETTARKFFNRTDVIGEIIRAEGNPSAKHLGKPIVISAVVKNPPANSSLQFDAIFPFRFIQLSFEDKTWLNAYLGTYVVLHPESGTNNVIAKFNEIYAAEANNQLLLNKKEYGFDPQVRYGLQRMTDIHLNPLLRSNGNNETGVVNGSKPIYSYLFLAIAGFILLMAAINFINISIAASLKRKKEVGIRKIVGGSRLQIVLQFLVESAILCVVAYLLSVSVTRFCLPLFNELTGKQILFESTLNSGMFLYLITFLIGIILLTGLYPAMILSDFKPAKVLYNRQKLYGRNIFGHALIIIQFSLAVFLLIASVIYYRQMNYIRTRDLGYNPNQVVSTFIPGDRNIHEIYSLIRNELSKEPSIKNISFGGENSIMEVKTANKNIDAYHIVIDENYLPLMEIPLISGRNFSPRFKTDTSNSVIVNEAFIREAGLTNPVGTNIKTNEYFDKETRTIIGVVKNYHFGSLHQRIKPMVMIMSNWYGGGVWIKVDKNRQQESIAKIEKVFKHLMPSAIFSYSFLDERNARDYLKENRWQKVITTATVLSLIICCLGLFGLAHLSSNLRIKEIGIRKILGASILSITRLLSGEFFKQVIIAILIAIPIAAFVMQNWLQNFAYRTSMSWWIFLFAAIIAILIALLTVTVHTVRTARKNPVRNLKTE